MFYYLINENGL